jgi:hypothetical protein
MLSYRFPQEIPNSEGNFLRFATSPTAPQFGGTSVRVMLSVGGEAVYGTHQPELRELTGCLCRQASL